VLPAEREQGPGLVCGAGDHDSAHVLAVEDAFERDVRGVPVEDDDRAELAGGVRTADRRFRQRDEQPALGTIVGRPQQPAIGGRDQQPLQASLGVQIDRRTKLRSSAQ
jgi:hypothetical protein